MAKIRIEIDGELDYKDSVDIVHNGVWQDVTISNAVELERVLGMAFTRQIHATHDAPLNPELINQTDG